MKTKNSDVNVKVGVDLDRKLEKKIANVDKALAQSRKRAAVGRKKQRKESFEAAKGQRAEADSAMRAARALQEHAAQMNKSAKATRRYNNETDKAITKTKRLKRVMDKAGRASLKQGKSALGGLGGTAKLGLVGTALGGAAAVGNGVGYAMNLQRRMTRLGVQANAGPEQINNVKNRVFSVAKRKDVAISPDALFSAVEKIVNKNGDLGLANSVLLPMAQAINSTGARGEDIGALVADIRDKFGVGSSDEIVTALDTLILQGKSGSFTLENLSTQGERVTAAYASTGRTGINAVKEMGSLLQIAKMGTGSPEQAATGLESLISDLRSNRDTISDEFGVDVFDQTALDEGKEIWRPITTILQELLEETDGKSSEFSKVFGNESIRVINALNTAEGTKKLKELSGIKGNGSQLAADSTRVAGDSLGRIEVATTKSLEVVDRKLASSADAVASGAESAANFFVSAETFYDELYGRFFGGEGGGAANNNMTVSNHYSISQQPGESGEVLARNIADEQGAVFARNNYSLRDDD